ncbi:MAG TPA: DUF4270 family protein [Bacteroidales bacterium]|nr:DUF4270 family protein [Bacteroidales bacterium]
MIRNLIYILTLPFLWMSCSENKTFDIGTDNVDVKSSISLIDTFTVNSYTVMLDSLHTSGLSAPSAVIGRFDDPDFGLFTASSFFTVDIPGTNKFGIQDDYVFDSLCLGLVYNKYYEGDTALPFTIDVHRLQQTIKTNSADGYFYNTDSIAAMPELFGSITFKPSPNSGDTIWIPIDSTFGIQLFTYMKNNNHRVTDATDWEDFFKGFMVRYGENNKSVMGFYFPVGSGSPYAPAMRVFYHYVQYSVVKRHVDFKSAAGKQFNRFMLYNPKVPFPKNLHDKLSSSETANRTFLHSGVGIVTRLEIPYLKNLYYVGNDIQILNAELEVEPATNTYTEETLPVNLSLTSTDDLNRWGSLLYNKSNRYSSFENLTIDMVNQENTRYTFEITNFIKSNLEKQNDDTPAMLMTISADDLYQTSRRLIIGSHKNRINKVRLKIYYMNIE